MSVIAELERKRLKPIFEAGGVGKPFKKNKKGKYYFTADAKKFIGAQAFDKKNQYIPAGTVWDETKQTIVPRNTILDKKGRLLKRLRKKGLTFKKKERTIQYKGQGFLTGSIRVRLQYKEGGAIRERQKQIPNPIAYTNTRQAEQKIKDELLPLVISEGERQFLISVEIINPIIIRNGKKTPSLADIKLRRIILQLDGYDTTNIDVNENECFRDAWMYRYRNCKRINKDALDPDMWDLFFSERDENYKTEGISCNDFRDWCELWDTTLLIVQDDRTPIVEYKSKLANPPLTFCACMRDGHIYLQTDINEIKSLTSSNFRDNGGLYTYKKTNKPKKAKEAKRIEFLEISKYKREGEIADILIENCRHQEMCKVMEQQNTNVLSTNIEYREDQIQKFTLNDIQYVFLSEEKKLLMRCFELEGLEYKGETLVELVVKYLEHHNIETSQFNPHVNQILLQKEVKDRTHVSGQIGTKLKEQNEDEVYQNVDILKKRYENENIITFDVKSCHTSILENPDHYWLHYTPKNEFEDYVPKDVLKPGFYFVETDDKRLFAGNNIYSYSKVQLGLELHYITHDNIKQQLIGDIQPKNIYTPVIKHIKEQCKNYSPEDAKKLCKLMCNTLSGLTGKTSSNIHKHYLTWNFEEMENHLITYQNQNVDINVFANKVRHRENYYYHYGHTIKGNRTKHNIPHYLQILDAQNIITHNFINKIVNGDWSRVLYRRVDSFTILNPKPKIYRPLLTGIQGMLRIEKNPLQPVNKEYKNIEFTKFNKEWNITKTTSSNSQLLFDLIEEGKSALITAPGGFGKTYMIEQVKKQYPKSYLCCAFMNIHAYRIGGTTLHNEFGFTRQEEGKEDEVKIHKNRLKSLKDSDTKVLIVDEVGLLGYQLWMMLYEIKVNCPQLSILCFGSFNQLTPVEKGDKCIYENHSLTHSVCESRRIVLQYTQYCRNEIPLMEFLKKIDTNDINQINKMMKTLPVIDKFLQTNIVATNSYRRRLNTHINNAFKTIHDDVLYIHEMIAKEKNGEKYSCYLYEGCKFIAIKTDNEDKKYYNGERFICKSFDSETITLQSYLRKDYVIQIPHTEMEKFDLAYALTCHKVQGDTLDGPVMIHEHELGFKHDNNWVRTAVERPRKLNQICLPSKRIINMTI